MSRCHSTLRNLHMCFRQTQQILLLLPVHATFSSRTDQSQAFKCIILKFKIKSTVTEYIPATVVQLDSVIYSNVVFSYIFGLFRLSSKRYLIKKNTVLFIYDKGVQ